MKLTSPSAPACAARLMFSEPVPVVLPNIGGAIVLPAFKAKLIGLVYSPAVFNPAATLGKPIFPAAVPPPENKVDKSLATPTGSYANASLKPCELP